MTFSRQGRAGACLIGALVVGCTPTEGDTTFDFTTESMGDPTETTFPSPASGTPETEPTPTSAPDPSGTTTGDPTSEPVPTTSTTPDDTTADDTSSTSSDDTTTGGLPEGYLVDGQRYPGDIVIDGGYMYWVNNWTGDCVRRAPLAGGPVEDIACEVDLFPLGVQPYNGKIAWTAMTESGGQFLGFGAVRVTDGPGQAVTTIDEDPRFKSSSSGALCNDTIAAFGDQLFWYSHILGGFNDGTIQRWNGSKVEIFPAGSEFPYGVVTTPTSLYWSATEQYLKMDPNAPENSMGTDVGMTIGSSCGRVAVGETIYVTSRGTFALPPALFVVTGGGVSYQRDLDDLVYDLAADATHLYLAYEQHIERLPIADLANGAAEVVLADAEEFVGGIFVDDTNFYWAESTYVGSIRFKPK